MSLDTLRRVHGGRLERGEEIGRGGMGAVYAVRDGELRRTLAMKVLLADEEQETQRLHRFLDEARITAQLTHPGVVPVHELARDEHGQVFFTMERVRGVTFGEGLRRHREGDGEWSLRRCIEVLRRACETLAFAHSKGVVHRDLKPDNLMVGSFGEVYVMDWGIASWARSPSTDGTRTDVPTDRAKSVTTAPAVSEQGGLSLDERGRLQTSTGAIIGTPPYMAPEQAYCVDGVVDQRADVFALGALLYELLAGVPPYAEPGLPPPPSYLLHMRAGPPQSIGMRAPRAPPELCAIVARAMARRPEHRYSTALALGQDLDQYLGGFVPSAMETGAWVEARKWVTRNPRVAATITAGLSVVAAVVTLYTNSLEVAREDAETAQRWAVVQERRQAAFKRRAELRASELGASLAALSSTEASPAARVLMAAKAVDHMDRAETRGALARALASGQLLRLETVIPPAFEGIGAAAFRPDSTEFGIVTEGGRLVTWDIVELRVTRELPSHVEPARALAYSSDGNWVATADARGAARVWSAGDDPQLAVDLFLPHPAEFLVFSPDSRDVAVGDKLGRFQIASPFGSAPERLVDVGATVVAATHGGEGTNWLVVCDAKGAVRAFDPRTGESIPWEGKSAGLMHLTTSHSGARVAGCGGSESIQVWDAATGRVLRTLAPPADADVRLVRFADADRALVGACADGRLIVWDVARNAATPRVHAGPPSPVIGLAAVPDRPLAAVITADRTIRLVDLRTGRTSHEYRSDGRHRRQLLAFDLSRDGTRALVGDHVDHVAIWDVRDGSRVRSVRRSSGQPITAVALLAGEQRVAIAAGLEGLEFYDVPTGDRLATPVPHQGKRDGVRALATNEDRTRLASGGDDGVVRIWDTTTLDIVTELTGNSERVDVLAFDPAGTQLAAGIRDGKVVRWIVSAPNEPQKLSGNTTRVRALAFDEDGSRLWGAGEQPMIREWELSPGGTARQVDLGVLGVYALAAHPNGKQIAAGVGDGEILLLDRETLQAVARAESMEERVTHVAFTPAGDLVASGADGSLRRWSTPEAPSARALDPAPRTIVAFDVSDDGRTVLATGRAGWVQTWNLETGAVELRQRRRGLAGVSADISPDASLGVTVVQDWKPAFVQVWDLAGGAEPRVLDAHGERAIVAAFTPGGDQVLVTGESGRVHRYDCASWELTQTAKIADRDIPCLEYSPDGKWIAFGSFDNNVRVWNAALTAELWKQHGPKKQVFCIDWSPDGTRVAAGSRDQTIHVFRSGDGALLDRLEGHDAIVLGVRYTREGTLISADAGGRIRVWDARSGTALLSLDSGHGEAGPLRLAPAGRAFFSAGSDSRIRSWLLRGFDWPAGQALQRAERESGLRLIAGRAVAPPSRPLAPIPMPPQAAQPESR